MKKTREEKEIIEKVGKHMRKKLDLEKTSGLKQWLVQCLKFDGFCVSLCHTSWVTTPSCPCGINFTLHLFVIYYFFTRFNKFYPSN